MTSPFLERLVGRPCDRRTIPLKAFKIFIGSGRNIFYSTGGTADGVGLA